MKLLASVFALAVALGFSSITPAAEPSAASPEDAILVVRACPACASEHVKPTLRMQLIQYFRCRDCGFSWRVDSLPA